MPHSTSATVSRAAFDSGALVSHCHAGLFRLKFAYLRAKVPVAFRCCCVGTSCRKQLVEHHAQRVNVAGCGYRLAFDLLRTGIAGSQSAKYGKCFGRLRLQIGAEYFGDAEVEELGNASPE